MNQAVVEQSNVMTLQMVIAIILIFFFIFIGLFAYWAYEAVWAVQGDASGASAATCGPCVAPVPAAGSLASVLLAAAALAWVIAVLFFIHLFVVFAPKAMGRMVGAITVQALAMVTAVVTLILLAYALNRITCTPEFQKIQGCIRILPQYVTVALVATVFALVLQIVIMVGTAKKFKEAKKAVATKKGAAPVHEHITKTRRVVEEFSDGSSESVSTTSEVEL